MSAWGADALVRLHAEITATAPGYRPPGDLLAMVNEEYRGYITGTTPGSLYYRWLALVVRLTKPTLVLELGSGLGVSALLMFSELSETARLVSCDVARKLKFVPPAALNDPRMKFYCGNDLDLNVFGDELPVGIDVLFVDTDHTFDQVSAEWSIYRHLCSPGALVILDDIRMNDMPRFWESLPYPKLDLTAECHASGFGVFRYEAAQAPSAERAYRESLRIAWARAGCTAGDPNRPAAGSVWRRAGRLFGLARRGPERR